MGLLEDCENCFGTRNLYEVLGIPKEASNTEVKKAYRKASLLCHPDRLPDEVEEATRKFQTLSKVHKILSEEELRKIYDETGSVDEEDADILYCNWSAYWRSLFPHITVSDINEYMENYKGSAEEREDLIRAYIQYEGDMNKISSAFIGYTVDEEEKYADMLREMIRNEEIPDFPQFSKEKKSKKDARIKRFKREEKECEGISASSLIKALEQRHETRKIRYNDLMKDLEEKYCKKINKTKKKK